jgi:hypothetical protein
MRGLDKGSPNILRDPVQMERICLSLYLVGIVGKFWLVANTDIADAHDDPWEYVVQVLHPLQGGIAYGPGTGLFGFSFYQFGIPFRIGLEVTFMFAVTWVLGVLIDWPRKSYLACGLFLFALFNPAPAELFSHFLSDQIWMVLTMIGLAYLVLALREPLQLRGLFLTCSFLLLGLATITRTSYDLLMGCMAFLIGATTLLILCRGGFRKTRASLAIFLLSTFSVVLGVSAIYYVTCFFDSQRLHYFGISAVDCREYRNFYLCLQSVGEPTGVNYYPVDGDRRRLIATAGPDAKALMNEIDRTDYYKQVSQSAFGRHDIALGWFQFAVFGTYDSDIDKAYVQFEKIEQEIREAGQTGRLHVRSIPPLPDCRLNLVLPVLPASLQSTMRQTVAEPIPFPSGWSVRPQSYVDPDFTRALSRNRVYDSPIRFEIWRLVHALYAQLYRSAMVIFLFALVMAYWFCLAITWRPMQVHSLAILAEQIFALVFFALIFWYTLFDASGTPVMTRYMIFNNVMLPILLAYYVRSFIRTCRR